MKIPAIVCLEAGAPFPCKVVGFDSFLDVFEIVTDRTHTYLDVILSEITLLPVWPESAVFGLDPTTADEDMPYTEWRMQFHQRY